MKARRESAKVTAKPEEKFAGNHEGAALRVVESDANAGLVRGRGSRFGFVRGRGLSSPLSLGFAFAVVVAAAAPALAAFGSIAPPFSLHVDMVLPWLSTCLATGILEEVAFRFLVVSLLVSGFEWRGMRHPALAAMVTSASLFGLLHLASAGGFVVPEGAAGWVQMAVKPMQAFFFGMTMSLLYARTKSLVVPIVVHVVFDLICFSTPFLLGGTPMQTHITNGAMDACALVFSAMIWGYLCFKEYGKYRGAY